MNTTSALRRMTAVLLCTALALSAIGFQPVRAWQISDWIPIEELPSDARVLERKWTAVRTTRVDSIEPELSGFICTGSEWILEASGSKRFADFPAGFDTSDPLYGSVDKSPYEPYETQTRRRSVSRRPYGYIYWHWMYDVKGADGTDTRTIHNRSGFVWFRNYRNFGAFYSTKDNYASDTRYSGGVTNYIIPDRTAYADCQGATRWYRFPVSYSYYSDYFRLFHYERAETLESSTEIKPVSFDPADGSSVSVGDIRQYVRYVGGFTVSYDAAGGTDAPETQTKLFGVDLTLSTREPVKPGQAFRGWSDHQNGSTVKYHPGDVYLGNADLSLYAIWQDPSGTCGDSLKWSIHDGTLSITGNGAIPDFVSADAVPWYAWAGDIERVELDSGITAIGAYAFQNCTALTEISLPGNLKSIGARAFQNCTELTELVLPGNVKSIGESAFQGCTALLRLTISDHVASIGANAFTDTASGLTIRCYEDSEIARYAAALDIGTEYLERGRLETPVFTQKSAGQSIVIELSAPKGTIHYTTDGSTPTRESPVYTGPVTVRTRMTIQAIACESGWTDSDIAVLDTSVGKVMPPTANHVSGSTLAPGTRITLRSETPDAVILYTTNGEIPSERDVYKTPFAVTEDVIVYAMAVKEGMQNSTLSAFRYRVNADGDLPAVETMDAQSVTTDSAALYGESGTDAVYAEFVYYAKNNSANRYTVTAVRENPNSKSDTVRYHAALTGLSADTEYWYQLRAVNQSGWNSGAIRSFLTDPAPDNSKPASIELDPVYLSMRAGQSKTLLATVLPVSAADRRVHWSSENPEVAAVDASGTVSALSPGTARIRAVTVAGRLAAYCTIEVISGEVTGALDFSEWNMMTNSSLYDDYGFDHNVNDGGNAIMASAYLARWDGVVPESDDPYPANLNAVRHREIDSLYHVQNILYLPYRSHSLDNDEIKQALMKYGAVFTAIKVNYAYFSNNQTDYYLPPAVTANSGGHAVAIIGWDDNYPASKFRAVPDGDGAFICKNSWGTESGENGFFYVSYYDKFIARDTCGDYNAVFYDLQNAGNYNKIYQYDYLGPVTAVKLGSKTASAANVFPESGRVLEQDESLQAVSCYNYAPGTAWEIYVVPEFTGPESLQNPGEAVQTGVFDCAGYFTIDLDQSIPLSAGTRFAVIVKYLPSTGSASIFVEAPVKIKSGGVQIDHSSKARANPDESYISSDGRTWIDYTHMTKNANVCIKAFTNAPGVTGLAQGIDNTGRTYVFDSAFAAAQIQPDLFDVNLSGTDTQPDGETVLLEDENNLGSFEPSVLPDLDTNRHYAEGAALPASYDLRTEGCVTPIRNQGNIGGCWSFAAYASLESAILKADSKSASRGANLSQNTDHAVTLELDSEALILAVNTSAQILASLTPADTPRNFTWTSSDPEIASVTAYGIVTAHKAGTAVITASAAGEHAQCRITVTAPAVLRRIELAMPDNMLLSSGTAFLPDYILTPSNCAAQTFVWTSSDSAVASVDAQGLITAHHPGMAVITVSAGTVSASCTVQVAEIPAVMPCSMELMENTLMISDGVLNGECVFRVKNTSSQTLDAIFTTAFYTAEGQIVSIFTSPAQLISMEASDIRSGYSIPNLSDENLIMKVFLLDSASKPLSTSLQIVIHNRQSYQ